MKPIIILAMLCSVAAGQEFKSAPAKKAKEEYDAELRRLDGLYEKAHDAAKKKYVAALESARKGALIRNDLDEAQRIVEAKNELADTSKPKQNTTAPIVGTQWGDKTKFSRLTPAGEEIWYKGKLHAKHPGRLLDPYTMLCVKESHRGKCLRIWILAKDRKTVTFSEFHPSVEQVRDPFR